MYSTALELAGFTCFIVMAALAGGAIAALGTAGAVLLFVGASTNDAELSKNVRALAAVPLRTWLRLRNAYRAQMLAETLRLIEE